MESRGHFPFLCFSLFKDNATILSLFRKVMYMGCRLRNNFKFQHSVRGFEWIFLSCFFKILLVIVFHGFCRTVIVFHGTVGTFFVSNFTPISSIDPRILRTDRINLFQSNNQDHVTSLISSLICPLNKKTGGQS